MSVPFREPREWTGTGHVAQRGDLSRSRDPAAGMPLGIRDGALACVKESTSLGYIPI